MDKSDMSLLQTRNNLISNEGNLISMEKQAQQTENSIKELHTQKSLKYEEMKMNIITSYNRFMENVNAWEHNTPTRINNKGFIILLDDNTFVEIKNQRLIISYVVMNDCIYIFWVKKHFITQFWII